MRVYLKFTFLIAIFITDIAQAQPTGKKGTNLLQGNTEKGKIFALVIGVSDYSILPKLNFADADAQQFYNYLKENVPVEDTDNLSILLNHEVTRDIVAERLYDITEKAKTGDKVFLYFSGHGDVEQLIQTDNCLLLLSSSPIKNYLRKCNSYLDIDLFKSFFSRWTEKNVKVVFVCDACHSGSLIGGEAGRKNMLFSLQQEWAKETKLLSCQPDQVSLEGKQWGGGRGLFSWYFILGIKGLADNDNNGYVTLFELDNFLRENVSKASEQSQIPIAHGDLKSIVSKVSVHSLAAAKIELGNVPAYSNNFVLKGAVGSISDLIKDSSAKALYNAFTRQLNNNQLLLPDSSSAYYYYKLFSKRNDYNIVKNSMSSKLMQSLQNPFDRLTDYVYNDEYEKFGIEEKFEIEKNLKTALDIAGSNNYLVNRIKSKLLFLEACELSIDIKPGNLDYYTIEKLNKGIDLLKRAIAIDSISPYLLVKLGDYCLYTHRFVEAIDSYTKYQQLLPNDEHSYNRLGMAYMAVRKKDLAIEAFKKSIKINSEYVNAISNLEFARSMR